METAPFYHQVREIVEGVIEKKYANIADLNINSVQSVLNYLGIQQNMYRLSELEVNGEQVKEPDEWGIIVAKSFKNVDEYWNAPGGKTFYDVNKYHQNGLGISFINTKWLPI